MFACVRAPPSEERGRRARAFQSIGVGRWLPMASNELAETLEERGRETALTPDSALRPRSVRRLRRLEGLGRLVLLFLRPCRHATDPYRLIDQHRSALPWRSDPLGAHL